MGATFAVLAALAFAVGSVLQQRGTLSTDAPEGDPLSQTDGGRGWVTIGGLVVAVSGIILLSQPQPGDRASYHPSRVTPRSGGSG